MNAQSYLCSLILPTILFGLNQEIAQSTQSTEALNRTNEALAVQNHAELLSNLKPVFYCKVQVYFFIFFISHIIFLRLQYPSIFQHTPH